MNSNISFFAIIFQCLITFIILLALARMLGKKQMSELTFFNYITGITIGSIAGNMINIDRMSFLKLLTSLIFWCFLTGLLSFISLKSYKLRFLIEGEPTTVIKKGKVYKKTLSSLNLNMGDLNMLLRKQGIFTVKDVNYAILECYGKLSALKKEHAQIPNKNDLNISTLDPLHLPTEIICDNKVLDDISEF